MAVTDVVRSTLNAKRRTPIAQVAALGILLLLASMSLQAEVLDPDRVDVMYHSYDGGGATIDGPSVLVRKNIGSNVAVSANYYVDMVSSASIDVLATASEYSEKRTEYSLGTEYLHDRTIISAGYTSSEENDYSAETGSLGISQSFFGDLTTLSFGFSFGKDVVGKNGRPNFEHDVERRRYQLNLTQVITKSFIAAASVEAAVDEGYLNNPYRQVRYLDPDAAQGYSYQAEVYPHTRNSDAVGLRGIYYLPYRASIRADARYYDDSWGITAKNWALRYTQPWGERWLFEVKYRAYQQTNADFYSDLFPFRDAQNFLARDKELSEYQSDNFGLGVTYDIPERWLWNFEKSTINLYWDYFDFNYDNFRNVLDTEASPGEEPLYSFDANVIRFYWSLWY